MSDVLRACVRQAPAIRPMRLLGALRVPLVIAALGCQPSETADDPVPDTTAEPTVDVQATPWYRGVRVLDLTGDGRADSVRLEAWGVRPDSLDISLLLVVEEEERHRERWASSYELALLDSVARPRLDDVLRARLDSVLASVVVQRLDAPGVRIMAEDRAVLAGLDPRPTQRVSFSYGYETTTRLVWDAPRERFVRLWSCC